MFVVRLLVCTLAVVFSYSPPDPFIGSDCDCDRFCRYECAINATNVPVTMKVYRMTMKGVYDLRDKNTGDVSGDTSFVLSRKSTAYQCSKNPNSFLCKDVAQFSGDDKSSTDVVLEMKIEADGQWGPYLECNPTNISNPLGEWGCENGLSPAPPANYPAECTHLHYDGNPGYCVQTAPNKTLHDVSLDQCCQYLSQSNGRYLAYNYMPEEQTCLFFTEFSYYDISKCSEDITLGLYDPPDPNLCKCERVYKAVGKQNISAVFGQHSTENVAGGFWYSHPAAGQCGQGQNVGDSSGCTYKVLDITRAINASCLYQTFDSAVQAHNPLCFDACSKPFNVTSTCYLTCFALTTNKMRQSELVQPWADSFASEGCPEVPIDPATKKRLLLV